MVLTCPLGRGLGGDDSDSKMSEGDYDSQFWVCQNPPGLPQENPMGIHIDWCITSNL